MTRAGKIEERYVYASHQVPSSILLDSSYEELTGKCTSPSVASPLKAFADDLSLKCNDSLTTTVHLEAGGNKVVEEEFDELAEGWDDDEGVVDERDVWSHPRSSISVESDPFEYSSYLSPSQPACHQRADSEPAEKTDQIPLYHCDPPRAVSRQNSSHIPYATMDSVVSRQPALNSMSPGCGGPSKNVFEALQALRSIQARESSLFGDWKEEQHIY